jgi:transcriptional regulator with XRE-family HTH domain
MAFFRPPFGPQLTSGNHNAQAARRAELAVYLRARRAQLAPLDVGLPEGSASGRRRTPGLRREEIAQLSGVGVTWYTWLEQGRDISASVQVIDALARALLLTDDEHRHLRELAGLSPPEPPVSAVDMLPRLQRLVDAEAPCPASVYDEHYDYLVWNEPYAVVRHDPGTLPANRRNMLWMMFTAPENRARMVRWESAARAVLSQFRVAAGRRPGDPRFTELVEALSEASPQFRGWWAEHPVRYFRPAVIGVRHPSAGLIRLEMFQLRLVDQPGLVMVVQVPVGETSLARVRSLLRPAVSGQLRYDQWRVHRVRLGVRGHRMIAISFNSVLIIAAWTGCSTTWRNGAASCACVPPSPWHWHAACWPTGSASRRFSARSRQACWFT